MNESHVEIDWVEVTGDVQLPDGSPGVFNICVSKYPVTVQQYQAFVDADGYGRDAWWSPNGLRWRNMCAVRLPSYWNEPQYSGAKLPVTGVSFWEAEAFARYANADLPIDTEWELVASNLGRTRFPWGNTWYEAEEKPANLAFFGAFGASRLTEVDAFPLGKSASGVWDLIGNASEWCRLGVGHSHLPETTAILCGGCFWHTPIAVDAASRDFVAPSTRDNQTGIRLIRRSNSHPAIAQAAISLPVTLPSAAPQQARHELTLRPLSRPTRPFRQEGIPRGFDQRDWRLRVSGCVRNSIDFTTTDLKSGFRRVTTRGMFVCVCRWGQVSTIQGVLLRDVIDRVLPTRSLDDLFLLQRSVPGPTGRIYESTIPLTRAMADEAMLCDTMDDQPLTLELGAPLRLIDLNLYGYKQVKCLQELVVTDHFDLGWWEKEKGYDPLGEILPGTITVVGERPYKLNLSKIGRAPIM